MDKAKGIEPSILVCGLLAADIIFDVDIIPTSAIKYRANNVNLICGGGGCYAAIAINRLGGKASVLAKIGDDVFGQVLLEALSTEGIDHSSVMVDKHLHTPISSIALDAAGERQILNYRSQSPNAFTSSLSFQTPPSAVLVDARWIEGSVSALQYARTLNIPGVVDAEAPVSEEVMSLASHIAFSRQGLTQYASTESILEGLLKAAKQFDAWVCVTDGEKGTLILNGHQLDTIPAPKVDAVDTLGAGDVWHGAFTLRLAQGASELNAVTFANMAAALKCTQPGGGWAAPTHADVTEFTARLK